MPKLIIELDADTHKKLKLQAVEDDRSLNKYLTRGLEYLANMPVPYYKLVNNTSQPQTYIPPTPTSIPESPMGAPIITTSSTQSPFTAIPSTSTPSTSTPATSMTSIQLKEQARKLMAEAQTLAVQEREDARAQARALTPEEEQLNQQKLELQKQKIQEKRDKLIHDKAVELDLDLYNIDAYNEDRALFDIYGERYLWAKGDEIEKGTPNPYKNKPIEEIYKGLEEVKQREIEEKKEEDRRDALPHDIDDYDYKSEDFLDEISRLENVWVERNSYAHASYDDEDYKILKNYYFNNNLYHEFEEMMNHPYYAFDEDKPQDLQTLSNIFNRDKDKIDVAYVNHVMQGMGAYYRNKNKCKSYYEAHQEERAEWQRIIDESKK